MANTLAYSNTTTITAEKSFRVHAPVACTINVIFNNTDCTVVIYDRNDCGQYYKTTITAKASISYDLRLRL